MSESHKACRLADSARFYLRDATADAHARLDAMMSRLDLADAADYARFLRAQAAPFLAVEAALDAAGAEAVVPDWPQRRRAEALKQDLAALGEPIPEPAATVSLTSAAAILGAAYVLEGSRLGGAMLVRTLPDTAPKAFLTPGNPLLWRTFTATLDERLSSGDERAEAARSACAVFDLFSESARRVLGVDPS
jgi:heme oxygenase (biliverdin-IX-beta and delta-forming)